MKHKLLIVKLVFGDTQVELKTGNGEEVTQFFQNLEIVKTPMLMVENIQNLQMAIFKEKKIS